jgi:hypothetical protein
MCTSSTNYKSHILDNTTLNPHSLTHSFLLFTMSNHPFTLIPIQYDATAGADSPQTICARDGCEQFVEQEPMLHRYYAYCSIQCSQQHYCEDSIPGGIKLMRVLSREMDHYHVAARVAISCQCDPASVVVVRILLPKTPVQAFYSHVQSKRLRPTRIVHKDLTRVKMNYPCPWIEQFMDTSKGNIRSDLLYHQLRFVIGLNPDKVWQCVLVTDAIQVPNEPTLELPRFLAFFTR